MRVKGDDAIDFTINLLNRIHQVRGKILTNLNELRKSQLSILEYELRRVSNVSTSGGLDPRINMIEERIKATKQDIKVITNQLEISRIIVPKIKEGEILVHGRITDEDGHGRRNCEVSLVVKGQKLDIVGESDASGYYSIILPSTIVNSIKQNEIFAYIHYGTVMIHKVEDPIKIDNQHQTKLEVILSEDEIRMMHLQEKDKKVAKKKR